MLLTNTTLNHYRKIIEGLIKINKRGSWQGLIHAAEFTGIRIEAYAELIADMKKGGYVKVEVKPIHGNMLGNKIASTYKPTPKGIKLLKDGTKEN